MRQVTSSASWVVLCFTEGEESLELRRGELLTNSTLSEALTCRLIGHLPIARSTRAVSPKKAGSTQVYLAAPTRLALFQTILTFSPLTMQVWSRSQTQVKIISISRTSLTARGKIKAPKWANKASKAGNKHRPTQKVKFNTADRKRTNKLSNRRSSHKTFKISKTSTES